MAKTVLILEACPVLRDGSPFIQCFQTQAILYLRGRGLLTETQVERTLLFLRREPE